MAQLKTWPFNGLHSYASYHLAHFKDAARLALEMGRKDTSVIFGDYRELVRADEAAKYWQIEPSLPSPPSLRIRPRRQGSPLRFDKRLSPPLTAPVVRAEHLDLI
jgi:hypothetical protein